MVTTMTNDIQTLLGEKADSLLGFDSPKIPKERLQLPGPDFVDRVFRGPLPAGLNTVDWGGQTEDGRKLGNGVYLLRVIAAVSARQESVVLKLAVWND